MHKYFMDAATEKKSRKYANIRAEGLGPLEQEGDMSWDMLDRIDEESMFALNSMGAVTPRDHFISNLLGIAPRMAKFSDDEKRKYAEENSEDYKKYLFQAKKYIEEELEKLG